ncbi:hypothetical protein B0T19DRAFT_405025 [Cercophora scortea]|uniref:6-methylsalicylate decarboxylase n=1 Tax=Cercophora scortea TaxID=314031 RepID=A0AAE0I2M8_9PEZI|nr:hypothetical protein B0T19DRAFT_405025 [Cercophora scortea]
MRSDYIAPVLSGLANLQGIAQQWYLDKTLTWPAQPAVNKIDVHHHMVPDFYAQAIEEAGGDPSGWHIPKWSASSSRLMMKHLGIQSSILSVSAPGPMITTNSTSQIALARRLNTYAAALRDDDHAAFGFFASLPDILLHQTAALSEITYAFDNLSADGVTLFTRYGPNATYLGNPSLEPVWAELDRRAATVFVHPTHPVDVEQVNPYLPLPLVDYPHETTRAAVDMITRGTLKRYPNVKVILSHAGGTLPYVMDRFLTLSRRRPGVVQSLMGGGAATYEEAREAFGRFYYDVALSTAPGVLRLLVESVGAGQVVYGSDFPYAQPSAYPAFLEELEKFDFAPSTRDQVNFANAQKLFGRFGKHVDVAEPKSG